MKPTKQTVYLHIEIKEDKINIPSSVPQEKWGVHRTHCCKKHGCKYGNEYCPVILGHIKQDYKCEDSNFDNDCFEPEINELQKQEGYFFTPEQLNEYTANVIKQALETAAKSRCIKIFNKLWKAYSFESGTKVLDRINIEVDKQSITNTFEEIFKKFKV